MMIITNHLHLLSILLLKRNHILIGLLNIIIALVNADIKTELLSHMVFCVFNIYRL